MESVFVPSQDKDEDEEKPKKTSSAEHDELLGNAFDAFSDGDREGFVRSMRAACRAMKR